jgi:DNA-binding transcriptional ArsR family regulator
MVYRSSRKRSGLQRAASTSLSGALESQLDEVFFALSHPARRRMLARLGERGDQSVAPLSEPLQQSPAQVTKHLAILERAGLISRRVEGREHRLHFEPSGLRPALDWVARHRELWSRSLDRLEQFLDSVAERDP